MVYCLGLDIIPFYGLSDWNNYDEKKNDGRMRMLVYILSIIVTLVELKKRSYRIGENDSYLCSAPLD